MIVYDEIQFESVYELDEICWQGARDRVLEVEKLDDEKQEQFMDYLKENLGDIEHLTTTELNDFIWFECDDFIEELKEGDEE